jgi:long-chain acyl-CoA synthetase
MRFCSAAFNLRMFQGYGLTETCASATLQPVEDGRVSVAGFPTACTELRLRSCLAESEAGFAPEALDKAGNAYLATDAVDHRGERVQGRGEVQLRGPAVALGYYRNSKLTVEAFTKDGWFRTGDIGAIKSDGSLEIVDRLKNLVKLRTGEYIALENMELVYSQSELIDPIAGGLCCYGDGDMDRPVALVQVTKTALLALAKKLGIEVNASGIDALAKLSAVRDSVREALDAKWKAAGLYPIEKLAAVEILVKPWTAEEGTLTATNKISRHGIARVYRDTIDKLKKEINSLRG